MWELGADEGSDEAEDTGEWVYNVLESGRDVIPGLLGNGVYETKRVGDDVKGKLGNAFAEENSDLFEAWEDSCDFVGNTGDLIVENGVCARNK